MPSQLMPSPRAEAALDASAPQEPVAEVVAASSSFEGVLKVLVFMSFLGS